MPLLALLLLFVPHLVPPVDSTDVPPRPSLRFYPSALYSPSSGFGVGAGLNVAPLFTRHGFVLLTAAPAQHTGRYTLTASTYDLDEARDGVPPGLYGALFGSYDVNGRQWYYGLGPEAQRNNQVQSVLREVRTEVRVGTYVTPSLMLQPHAGWSRADLDPFAKAPAGMDPSSARNLQVASERVLNGHFFGLRAVYDTRDRLSLPRRGVHLQLELQRFRSWDSPTLRFDAARLWAYGFLPLAGQTVLALRTMLAAVYDRGKAPVPFYRLPEPGALVPGIADFRYYGRHMLAVGAEVRRPVFSLYDLVAIEAVGAVHLTSVYSDLLKQFSPTWNFAEDLDTERSRYPLRPILGLGLRLTSPARDRVLISVMLRYSPFGIGVGSLSFFHDLRELER